VREKERKDSVKGRRKGSEKGDKEKGEGERKEFRERENMEDSSLECSRVIKIRIFGRELENGI